MKTDEAVNHTSNQLDTSYHHVRNYVCTLTQNSIAATGREPSLSIHNQLGFVPNSLISVGRKLQLRTAAIEFITQPSKTITTEDDHKDPGICKEQKWVEINKDQLTQKRQSCYL